MRKIMLTFCLACVIAVSAFAQAPQDVSTSPAVNDDPVARSQFTNKEAELARKSAVRTGTAANKGMPVSNIDSDLVGLTAEQRKLAMEAEAEKNRRDTPVIFDTEDYCPSSYTDCFTPDDTISNVTFNGINHDSGPGPCPDKYEDYTDILSVLCMQGDTYSISVTVLSGIWTQHVRVWIDWDQDEVFAADESFYIGDNSFNPTVTADIIVPVDATPGLARMRVIQQWDSDPGADGACDDQGNHTYEYGETEDYTVLVSQFTTKPSPNELNVAVCSDISVTFYYDMDTATINDSTFLVNGMTTGLHAGVITYDSLTNTATFDPVADFAEGEIVTVVLTAGIESSEGDTLEDYSWSFTAASAGATGIFMLDSNYVAGTGSWSVFSADLDSDGDLDLAAANWNSQNVSVMLNNGDGTFAPQVTYASGTQPRSVFAADLDGDGDLDLAIANMGSDYVSVHLNNGNGTFAPDSNYAAGDGPASVFAADLDGDGDLDLAIASYFSNVISVFLNNGDGTFAPRVTYAVGNYPHSVFSADLDKDGDLDLAVANLQSDNLSVLLNDGAGSFGSPYNYAVGEEPASVFAADLDRDGDLDLATANYGSDDVSVLLNNGDGTLAPDTAYAAGDGSYSVFASDLDGDGDPDLAAVNLESDNISVFLNNGYGTFAPQVTYATGNQPRSVFVADLDGDGTLDLATANFDSGNISVLLNQRRPGVLSTMPVQNQLNVGTSADIMATFDMDMNAATINNSTFMVNGMCTGLHSGVITYDNPSKTATFDPTGDFLPGEIVTVVLTDGMESSSFGAPLMDYAWSFTAASAVAAGIFMLDSNYVAGDGSYSVFASDLDGDGDLDLAAANLESDDISVFLNNGGGAFSPQVTYAVGDQPRSVFAADLNGDGALDLATANFGSNNISVLLNNGDGTFAPDSVYVAGTGPWSVFSADLDSDGDLDLAAANWNSQNVSVMLNNGDGTFAPRVNYYSGTQPRSVFAADLDGDGDLDLAAANMGSDYVSVHLNYGNDIFAPQVGYAAGDGPASVFAADLDVDGDLDLAIASYFSNVISVLLNNGDGTFAPRVAYAVGDRPHSVFSADLDGDGDLDLAVANLQSNNLSVLLNDGAGSFGSPYNYAVGEGPASVFAADLDGDGGIDLATANYGFDNVSVLLNESLGFEYLPGDANMAVGSWPPQVIGGDVTYLVSYFRGLQPACLLDGFYCSGDANGDCLVIGSDVTRMVAYFRGLVDITPCADYEPAWPIPDDLPAEAPGGWPNCETPPVSSKIISGSSIK